MKEELNLHIRLENPPLDVDFGIQTGSGHHYHTLQIQRSSSRDLSFDCLITVKYNADNLPDFSGALVQGPSANRFIYVNIGTSAGQLDSVWSRRLKIPLRGITTEMITELKGDSTKILVTKVPGTGRDGGPTCGTVKPFAGWYVTTKQS